MKVWRSSLSQFLRIHLSSEACGIEVVLPIGEIEKRVLGNEAMEENVDGPDYPHDLVQITRECGQGQMSPLPCPICRVFLELFRNSLKTCS